MKKGVKSYYRGIGMMAGTIIGVGIFGVPFVMAQAGVLVGLGYFLILGILLIYNHLLYGEAILRTGLKHRLAGLAKIYMGGFWKYVTLVITMFAFYGALIAYIIIGGQFLHVLLAPYLGGVLFAYQIIFFIFMALFVLVGMRLVFFTELFMTIFILVAAVILIGAGLPEIDVKNFIPVNFSKFFLPYGVVLFSLSGAAAIPEVIDAMSRHKKRIKGVLILGTVVPLFLTVVFGLVVVGVNGLDTTTDAVTGLGASLGQWVIFLGAFFGFFAVATSFLVMALYLKDQFTLDMKINKHISWFLAVFIPFFIFLFGSRNFIEVIGFTGAVFAGFEGVLIVWIYMLAKRHGKRTPEYRVRIHWTFAFIMIAIFLAGVAYEVWNVLG